MTDMRMLAALCTVLFLGCEEPRIRERGTGFVGQVTCWRGSAEVFYYKAWHPLLVRQVHVGDKNGPLVWWVSPASTEYGGGIIDIAGPVECVYVEGEIVEWRK